jgi:ribonuclease E
MAKKLMLVNVIAGEESRIAILEDGTLDNLFIERASESQIVGNVYKAKVADVEQSLQAAFVDFGGSRQGFLHVSDIAPIWFADQSLAKKAGRDRVDISAILKRGQEILIQVSKEGIRNKAPAVTTYLSLAGRYLVLMPHIKRHGVSKKIDDEEERESLHKVLDAIDPPKDMGVIVRTAAANRPRKDIHRDLNTLLRLWMGMQKQAKSAKAPALLYSESDLVVRAVRDLFTPEIEQVLVDSKEAYEKIIEFMSMSMPASRKAVQLYEDAQPLFSRHKLEEQIDRVHQSRVSLKGGGYIIIEQTEALVAIDVNSGRFKKEVNAEETAYRINMQAAPEIGRQIRLRDLGGLIICDFIDMREESHKRDVERQLWEQLKRDRARTKMLRMSRFGLIEMTRQRVRRNIQHTHKQTCPTCRGTGLVRSPESTILEALRRIRELTSQGKCKRIVVRLAPENLVRLQNERRQELVEIERDWGGRVVLEPCEDGVDTVDVKCYKH